MWHFSNPHKSNKTHNNNTKLLKREEDIKKKTKHTTLGEMKKMTILLAKFTTRVTLQLDYRFRVVRFQPPFCHWLLIINVPYECIEVATICIRMTMQFLKTYYKNATKEKKI
jgi:hypothetical protein